MATILIVDDDANNRLLVKTVALHYGHLALEADDGKGALAICETERVDLVVLDLSMPGMDGPQLLRTLRGGERTRDVPVALYTATDLDAAMRDFMETYGVRCVIHKPAEPAERGRAIETALAR
jgi:CheY-like chemotaxis protein